VADQDGPAEHDAPRAAARRALIVIPIVLFVHAAGQTRTRT
jgi:hypothetical protein